MTEQPAAWDDSAASAYREDVTASIAATPAEPSPSPESSPGEHPRGEPAVPEAPPQAPVPSEPASPGSTPEASQPAADVPDPDLTHALELAGAKDVPEGERVKALGKWVVDANRRLADLAKENKALKGTPVSPAEPSVAPVQPEPSAAPLTPPPVQSQPAPPAAEPTDPEAVIEQQAVAFEESDQPCRAFAAQCDVTSAQIATIVDRDPKTGQFVGELPALDAEIASLKALLNPPEAIKGRIPALDPMDAERLKDDLSRLEFHRLTKVAQLRDLRATLKETNDQWGQRRYEIRQNFRDQHEAQRQEADRGRYIETKAQGYRTGFDAAFNAATTLHKVKEADRAGVYRIAKALAREDDTVLEPDRVTEWMKEVVKAEADRLDSYHRNQMAEYARLKQQDAHQPAPPPSAAVVPTQPAENVDWEERALDGLRADRRSA